MESIKGIFKDLQKIASNISNDLSDEELIFNYSKCLAMEISNSHQFFRSASKHIFQTLWKSLPQSERKSLEFVFEKFLLEHNAYYLKPKMNAKFLIEILLSLDPPLKIKPETGFFIAQKFNTWRVSQFSLENEFYSLDGDRDSAAFSLLQLFQ